MRLQGKLQLPATAAMRRFPRARKSFDCGGRSFLLDPTMVSATYLRVERISRLGRVGERLAEERLKAAGFEGVENLNRGINFRAFYDAATGAVASNSKIKLSPGAGLSISSSCANVAGHFA